jgi:hypothetical protein
VIFPWYYFGGGMNLAVGTNRYGISFARPNNQDVAWGRLLSALQLPGTAGTAANSLAIIEARRKVGDIRSARYVGAQWKRALHVGRVT